MSDIIKNHNLLSNNKYYFFKKTEQVKIFFPFVFRNNKIQ